MHASLAHAEAALPPESFVKLHAYSTASGTHKIKHGHSVFTKAQLAQQLQAFWETAPPDMRVRVSSACAPFASSWLAPFPSEDARQVWIHNNAFEALLRLRLGLPLTFAAAVDEVHECGLCLQHRRDAFGHHALACPNSGAKWRVHNAVRDKIFWLAAESLWSPKLEANVFPQAPRRRADVAFSFLSGDRRQLFTVDVAVTSPFQSRAMAEFNSSGWAPGCIAKRYERTKHATYGALAAAAGYEFVPLVADSFGAFSPTALPLLRRLASAFAKREGIPAHQAAPKVIGSIVQLLAREIGRTLTASISGARRPVQSNSSASQGTAGESESEE